MKEGKKILIADDSAFNRNVLVNMLSDEYVILQAENGIEAISILNKQYSEIVLVLLDIVMPKKDGFDVLEYMKKNEWTGNIPVIMITSEDAKESVYKAYDMGVTDYITRPYDTKTVHRRVKNAIILYAKQKQLESIVMDQVLEKEKGNLLMVDLLSHIVEFRNGESGTHVFHIRRLTELLLKRLKEITNQYSLSPKMIDMITNAASLHDIGKISIPEEILNKPGKLTVEEFEIMKGHSAIGAEILEEASQSREDSFLQLAHDICRWHHERYDGNGYPDGLKGEEIPIAAQVVSLADVYDALTSKRVYKEAYTHEKAMEMIMNGECGVFNPLLLQCLKDIGFKLEKGLHGEPGTGISDDRLWSMTNSIVSRGPVSIHTLERMSHERAKYQFYASISDEIRFEYNADSKIISFSAVAAKRLGVSSNLTASEECEEFLQVFGRENLEKGKAWMESVKPEKPVKRSLCYLTFGERKHRFKVIARPLWDEEGEVILEIIGKFVDASDEEER